MGVAATDGTVKTVVAAGLFGATFFTNVAIVLIVIGAALGTVAFVVWMQNRDSLRALNDLLADKARIGQQALGGKTAGDGV